MTSFEPSDLVRVPFPHVDRRVVVARPALVVARWDTDAIGTLLWTLMVTNAVRAPWHGDILIPEWRSLGLIPSKVRTFKISTVEAGAATRIGRLDETTWREVLAIVNQGMIAA